MQFDLHTHSNASDGALDPIAVWALAEQQGINYFSLTDHDTLAGYYQLQTCDHVVNSASATRLISGVEISTAYLSHAIHIVALNFNSQDVQLLQLLEDLQQLRLWRAQNIALKLEAILNIKDIYKQVVASSACAQWQLGRPHFARFLVSCGVVDTEEQAFKKYLGQAKKAYIPTSWPDYKKVIATIVHAGGIAVLAHPLKYNLTRGKLKALVEAFTHAGGKALELVYHNQKINDTRYLGELCQRYQLYASGGSDFHDPKMTWAKVGHVPALPDNCCPVWTAFKNLQ